MADIQIDVEEAREYLAWINGKQLEELERRAAAGFDEPRSSWDHLREVTLDSKIRRAAWRIDELEEGTLSRREELGLAELLAELKREHPRTNVDSAWTAFLVEHPELEDDAAASRAPVAEALAPLVFTDDDLLTATREAIRQMEVFWLSQHGEQLPPSYAGAGPSDIAAVLRGETEHFGRSCGRLHGDSVRVGHALGRLAREGRVVLASPLYERARRWAPGGVA